MDEQSKQADWRGAWQPISFIAPGARAYLEGRIMLPGFELLGKSDLRILRRVVRMGEDQIGTSAELANLAGTLLLVASRDNANKLYARARKTCDIIWKIPVDHLKNCQEQYDQLNDIARSLAAFYVRSTTNLAPWQPCPVARGPAT